MRFSGQGKAYEGLIHRSTGGWNGTVRLAPQVLGQPIRWQRRRRIFVNSMSDLFHKSVPDEWIDTIFGIMWACLYNRHEQPGHVFQILTKRPERMRDYLLQDRRRHWAQAAVNYGGGLDPDGIYDQTLYFEGPHPRIWLGVSVENQAAADERIPVLLKCPAAVRWLSCEPLLGPVDLQSLPRPSEFHRSPYGWHQWLPQHLHWVVAGGESGPGARPMHPDWARSLRDQCASAGVPFFFKQWGEWAPIDSWQPWHRKPQIAIRADGSSVDDEEWHEDGCRFKQIGKRAAGRLLDGIEHNGFPEQRT